jgi:hypothetical protein
MNNHARQRAALSDWPPSWPSFTDFLGPLSRYIKSTLVLEVNGGNQAIIHFDNGYGVSIFQDYRSDPLFFEVTPLRFHCQSIDDYESIHQGIPFMDHVWGYLQKDILDFCTRISLL